MPTIDISEVALSLLQKRLRGDPFTNEENHLLEDCRYGDKPIETIDEEIMFLLAVTESEGL